MSAANHRTTQVEKALCQLARSLPSDAILTDQDVLHSYGRDESDLPAQLPQAVVRIRKPQDVQAALEAANTHDIPLTARGAGTGRTGGAVPTPGGIVLSWEQCDGIKDISRANLTAVVEPGAVLGTLHQAVEDEGLFYPPDPNSLSTCTLAGNVAENAAGPRSLRYGTTRDYVLGLEIVTGSGQAMRVGKRTMKGVTGYDLTSLLVGSEGTLALTTEITLKLLPKPEAIATLMVFLPDLKVAGNAVGAALGAGFLPRCVEMMDEVTLELLRPQTALPIPQAARALLIVELDGPEAALENQLERCGNTLDAAGALEILVAKHGSERERLWEARRDLSHALRNSAEFKLAEDVVVPRNDIPQLLELCARISTEEHIHMPTYGHAGDGNMHVNFLWNSPDERPQVDRAIERLFRAVLELGGTLSGEHGIGLLKAPYLSLELSQEQIALQQQIKRLFDPKGILNPDKIFPIRDRAHGPC